MLHLSQALEQFVLSAFPSANGIVDIQSYRPGYLDFPARIALQNLDGTTSVGVLKLEDHPETLHKEVRVAAALAEFGLPVATALAGPVPLTDQGKFKSAILWNELPGTSLPWVNLKSLDDAYLTYRLLRQGVLTLHSLTPQIRRHPLASYLPTCSLQAELDDAIAAAGRWLEIDGVARTVDWLQKTIPTIQTELVFSNGDYNAINFLHKDGELSGFVDFEFACFEDPYIGFSKMIFWSYDDYGWGAGRKAGIVERFLFDQGVSKRDFAPRLALRCLTQLMRDVSLDREADQREMGEMLCVLEGCLETKS